MIDTIRLELPQSMYTIIDHTKFTPSTYPMFTCGAWNSGTVTFSKQNPTNIDKKAGIYKPRLTITRRPLKNLGYQNTLYVELSLPKLVFGNNFDELSDEEFNTVLDCLYEVLKTMGVLVYKNQLPQAQVSAIHYGKNIILDDYTTPYTYIKELKNIDISKTLDVNQTDYRNGGLSYKLHTNLFEFAFYDKIKELEISKFSEKRSLEKDNYCQLSLLDYMQEQKQNSSPFEVLRLELRLNNRKKIKQYLKRIGLQENSTLEYLFDQQIAKKILLSFYDSITNKGEYSYKTNSLLHTFESLKKASPKSRDQQHLELCSALSIINDVGVREFRNLIEDRTWYRIKKQLEMLKKQPNNYLIKIQNNLNEFIQAKLVDYPQLMINNDKYET